jgi:hypothetical protein
MSDTVEDTFFATASRSTILIPSAPQEIGGQFCQFFTLFVKILRRSSAILFISTKKDVFVSKIRMTSDRFAAIPEADHRSTVPLVIILSTFIIALVLPSSTAHTRVHRPAFLPPAV